MWIDAHFPVPPKGRPTVRVVDEATLTTFGQGRLRVAWAQPQHFVSGAVYDQEGSLVPESQRVGGLAGDHALSVDPPELPPWDGATRDLPGTWLYGGTWFNHFGHFLTETVTSLWPDETVDGLLFHPFWFGGEVLPWQGEMLGLLGTTTAPVIVGEQRLRVERLLLPTRAYLPNGHARKPAVQVWQRIARAARREQAGDPPRRIYLSRTEHHRALVESGRVAKRAMPNEAALDDLFHERGYQVVHAEQWDVVDQIRLAAGAEVIAGRSGSATHLSVFARPDAPTVVVGDARAQQRPVLNQLVLNHAVGQPLGFVPYVPGGEGFDLAAVSAGLDELGV